tara:strand:+ start:520 stop:957 length:438 start_codon:yes stop_codon:yes gene_type:complete
MMTVPQKKYFCNRIDEITLEKISKLEKVEDLYDRRMAKDGLLEGKITYPTEDMVCTAIDRQLDGDGYGSYGYSGTLGNLSLTELLRGFEDYKNIRTGIRADENNELYKQERRLKQEATRIKDVAMFGTEEAAHAMLKEFVEWVIK